MDFDMDCFRPYDDLIELAEGPLISYLSSKNPTIIDIFLVNQVDKFGTHALPNSWLASPPQHPFWMFLLMRLRDEDIGDGPESVAGSEFLFQSILKFMDRQDVAEGLIPPIHFITDSK